MNDENSRKERLRENLDQCLYDISTAAKRSGRPSNSVVLLPVTKYVDAAVIRMLYDLGLRAFGESRVQRLTQLHRELDDLADLQWHMIGHLQRNKARRACECCTCIHSLDSLRLAKELVAQSTTHNRSLPKLYVEVNVAGESQKSGLAESELDEVLQFLSQVEPRASGSESTIAGLMTMPPRTDDPAGSRPYFRRLRELRDDRVARRLLPTTAGLSMGMSQDFDCAIEEGATIVRVGRRLYDGVLPAS